jgi:hypothetical protein
VSIAPGASRLARAFAILRTRNVYVEEGDHGAVAVKQYGLMHVRTAWASETELLIDYPPKARVFSKR